MPGVSPDFLKLAIQCLNQADIERDDTIKVCAWWAVPCFIACLAMAACEITIIGRIQTV